MPIEKVELTWVNVSCSVQPSTEVKWPSTCSQNVDSNNYPRMMKAVFCSTFDVVTLLVFASVRLRKKKCSSTDRTDIVPGRNSTRNGSGTISGRDSAPPLTFHLWCSHICAEKGC